MSRNRRYSTTCASGSPTTVETYSGQGIVYPEVTRYQVGIDKDTATTGTVALTAKTWNNSNAETITDQDGAAFSFDITALESVIIEGCIDEFIFTPSTVDADYIVNIVEFF